MSMLDHLATPNIQDAGGFTLNASYAVSGQRSLFAIDAAFVFDYMYASRNPDSFVVMSDTNKDGEVVTFEYTMKDPRYSGFLRTAWLFDLTPGRTNAADLTWLLGPSLSEMFAYSDTFYMAGMINALELDLETRVTATLSDRHSLRLTLAFPPVAIVTRLPWSTDPRSPGSNDIAAFFRTGTAPATVNTFQHGILDLDYVFALSDRLSITCRYSFDWLHYSLPRDITIVYNVLSLGVSL
jgi:hypothetical protein